MELAVTLLVVLLFAAPIGLVLLGVVYLLRRSGRSNDPDEGITELEARVESLRDAVENGQER